MDVLADVIRRESPITLVREAVWRTRKRWKRLRFYAEIRQSACRVLYQPAGYYAPCLEKIPEGAKNSILRFADLVCEGKFCRFGYGPVALGNPPRWDFDFLSGATWDSVPAGRLKVIRDDGSDVKIPWELSRLQFLPVLGKAWLLSREWHYRDQAKGLLDDWIDRNPPGWGINWTIAMESALRAVSICLLLELLAPFSQEEQSWLRKITKSLWEHLLFIEGHNEFSYFARSNHYLSNIVGLLHLSSSLVGPGMHARRRKYRGLVEQEIFRQVRDDGFDYEASTGYHFLVLQMFTSAWLVLRHDQARVSQAFKERLRNMYGVIQMLGDEDSCLPQVGDCDDGRLELLTDDLEQLSTERSLQRSSLRSASWAGIGGAILEEDLPSRDDDLGWYGFESRPGSHAPSIVRPREVLPSSGVAVASKGTAKLLFFAMPNGIFGKGSHTHNDKLSVVLRLGSNELLSDSGTFCYSRSAAKRNAFRSTGAHNTVTINGEEQNRYSMSPSRLFRICDDAKVSVIELEKTATTTRLRASHSGYQRMGIIHSRCVALSHGELVIKDELSGKGRALVKCGWHLPAGWRLQIGQATGRRLECRAEGPCNVRMNVDSMSDMLLQCTPAMISRAYGEAEKGTKIQVTADTALPALFLTHIYWEEL
jgi:hypothetical protein